MPYKPYPLIDKAVGESHGLVSWKSLENTYEEVLNARVHRGIIQRRMGYTFHGVLGTYVEDTNVEADEVITDTEFDEPTAIDPITGNYDIIFTDVPAGTQTAEAKPAYDMGLSYPAFEMKLAGGGAKIGEVHFPTDANPYFNCTWTPFTGTGGTLYVQYRYRNMTVVGTSTENMPMGLLNYIGSGGSEVALAFDRRRAFIWIPLTDRYDDVTETDIFTCEPGDFFFGADFEDRIAVCNNKDPLFYYDASTTTWKRIHTDWNNPTVAQDDLEGNGAHGSYSAEILGAKLLFRFRNRLVLLAPLDTTSQNLRRARWSNPIPNFDLGSSWESSGYLDCPTGDTIVSGALIGEELIVRFTNSIWRLAPVDDVIQPFRWERLSTGQPSRSVGGSIASREVMVTIADDDVTQWDGRITKSIIPDYRDKPSLFKYPSLTYAQAVRNWKTLQWLFSFEPDGSQGEFPTRVLVIESDGSVSQYEYPFHVYGRYYGVGSQAWDDFPQDFDDVSEAWDEFSALEGSTVILAGDRNQRIHRLNEGVTDNGASFETYLKTNKINPFKRGQQISWQSVKLGFVDVIVRVTQSMTLNFEVLSGFDEKSTKVLSVVLEPDNPGSEQVFIKRFMVNRQGFCHAIKVRATTDADWTLEGIVPWMRPAGKMSDNIMIT